MQEWQQKKYCSDTRKALRISGEFVSKKDQSGKVSGYFRNQEMKSSTEDKALMKKKELEGKSFC